MITNISEKIFAAMAASESVTIKWSIFDLLSNVLLSYLMFKYNYI